MSAPAVNPYAPPEAPLAVAADRSAGEMLRDGQYLILRSGAVLPGLCPVTAQPLPLETQPRRHALTWNPPWAWLGLPTGLLLIVFLLCTQKRGFFTYGVSAAERKRIRRVKGLTGLWVAGAATGLALESVRGFHDGRYLFAAGVLIVLTFMSYVFIPSLKVAGYRKGEWFKLSGCAPEFLETLPAVKFEDLH